LGIFAPTELSQYQNANAEHDGHVCHVEDACSHGPNPDIDEVDDAASGYTVHPIRCTSRNEQAQAKQRPTAPTASHRRRNQNEQHEPGTNRKQRHPNGRRQSGT
jgi:hypothetical protein